MSFLNKTGFKKITNYFVTFFIAFVFFLSFPIYTFAGGIVWDPGNNIPNVASAFADNGLMIKEYGLDTAAFILVNTILKKITAQTVNWINSGFKGNPAYVTNPGQFFLDVGDEQVSRFLSETSLANLCSPFKTSVRIALVKNYLSDTDNKVYSCTLDKLRNNYDAFMGDFDQGGWDGWFEMTQNQQNNPYGAYQDAQNKMNIEIGNKEAKFQKQLDWGKGVMSFERCKKENIVTQADISNGYGAEGYKVGDCYDSGSGDNKETVTPGGVIETQLNTVLGTGIHRIEVGDELNEVFASLLKQLTGRVIGGIGDGLRGTTESNSGGNSFMDQLKDEAEKPAKDSGKYVTCDANGNCDAVPQPPTPAPSLPQPSCEDIFPPSVCNGSGGGGGGSSHTECSNNACISVDGPGANQCGNDMECGGGGY